MSDLPSKMEHKNLTGSVMFTHRRHVRTRTYTITGYLSHFLRSDGTVIHLLSNNTKQTAAAAAALVE